MNEQEEKAYLRGERAALTAVIAECARKLGDDNMVTRYAEMVKEREAVVSALRQLCADYGDNDWHDDDHLGDVIEKHLACYFDEKVDSSDEETP